MWRKSPPAGGLYGRLDNMSVRDAGSVPHESTKVVTNMHRFSVDIALHGNDLTGNSGRQMLQPEQKSVELVKILEHEILKYGELAWDALWEEILQQMHAYR